MTSMSGRWGIYNEKEDYDVIEVGDITYAILSWSFCLCYRSILEHKNIIKT